MRVSGIFIVAILLLALSGCIGQETVNLNQFESVQASMPVDVDEDGENDVFVYSFAPVRIPQANIQIQRTLLAHRQVKFDFQTYNELTDYDLLVISQAFENFQQGVETNNKQCLQRVGLTGVNCIDARTCAKLCAASSAPCKKLAEDHEAIVGEGVLRYSQQATQLGDSFYQSLRTIATLIDMERGNRAYLINKLGEIINGIYANAASPLVQTSPITLCGPGIYDNEEFHEALGGIGTYRIETEAYRYTMLFEVSSLASQGNRTLTQSEMVFQDRLPVQFIAAESVLSPLTLSSNLNGSYLEISFEPIRKLGDKKQLFMYSFSSANPPENWIGDLRTPNLSMQVLDLQALGISAYIFDRILARINNPYMAFGMALAIPIAALLFLIFLLTLLLGVVRAVLAKENPMTGMRRAFSRTTIRWKTDLTLGVILLVAGIVAAFYFAPQLRRQLDIFGMGEYVTTEPAAFIASAGIFFGSVLIYLALENRVRVLGVEETYGREVKADKTSFVENVKELKEQLKVLRQRVDVASREGFDVSNEYDLLASISEERIDTLAKRADDTAMRAVQNGLIEVQEAVARLQALQKTAEQNWTQWKGMIEKMAQESEEVHASQLLNVPASLRVWALQKFVQEYGGDVALEGKVLKRKKISPERTIQALFDQGLVLGLVAFRNDKMIISKMSEGSNSVAAVLSFKLLNNIRVILRNFGYANFSSFASVGARLVLVVSKEQGMETLLVVPREKFRDALLAWKEKAAAFRNYEPET